MAYLAAVNPRKRRTKRRKHNPARRVARRVTRHKRRRHNPIMARTRRHIRRRRNPVAGGKLMDVLKASLAGAVGAVAVDAAWNYMPASVTAMLGTGNGKVIGKLGLAVLLGMVAQKVAGKKAVIAEGVAGAITVNLHSALVSTLGTSIPGLTLSGGGAYPTPGVNWDFSQSGAGGAGGALPAAAPLGVGPLGASIGMPMSGMPLSGYMDGEDYSGNY